MVPRQQPARQPCCSVCCSQCSPLSRDWLYVCVCGRVGEGRCHVAEPNWIEKEIKWSFVGHVSCRGQIDAMMHIWAVEQMQQFQLLWGTFLEDSAECATGLGTQHTSQEHSQLGRAALCCSWYICSERSALCLFFQQCVLCMARAVW